MIAKTVVYYEADLGLPYLAGIGELMARDSNLLKPSSMTPMDDCNHDC